MMRDAADEAPSLLLVDADRHEPALAGSVPAVSARRQAVPPGPQGSHLWVEQDQPNDLAAQRWCVMAPEGADGDAMLAAIDPLIAARREQQGAAVRVFRVPMGMSAAAAASWKREVFNRSEKFRRDLPRYQLLLGDLHQVSENLQVSQATDGFVGRLAFDRAADYRTYCEKLLAAEAAPPAGSRRAVFHSVQDGTAATETGHRGLVRPCVELARELRKRDPGLFPGEIVDNDELAPERAGLLRDAAGPGVLFTLSHGEGAPRGGWRSAAEQRARQGAMSFGRDEADLRGEQLSDAPLVPGGLWFMFACFGAGTPTSSKYGRWLAELVAQGQVVGRPEMVQESLPRAGEPPFVAAIPKATLLAPRGPLGFIGHVDLAWSYSFREVDGGRPRFQPGRFLDTLAAVLQGDRFGAAFRHLFRWFEQVNTELTTLDEDQESQALRRAQLWMLRQDLAGYTLLGDPAARLAAAPVKAVKLDAAAGFFAGMNVTAAQPVTTARLEQAIGEVLAGVLTAQKAAQGCGMPASELEELVRRYRAGGRAAIGR